MLKDVPRSKSPDITAILKAVHAQDDLAAAREKAVIVAAKLKTMRLGAAAKYLSDGVEETLRYMTFPRAHCTRICSNNMLERIMKEIRRRTRVVGAFPDARSALMLVAARLRHIAGTKWGLRRYLDMERLHHPQETKEAITETTLQTFVVSARGRNESFQSQGYANQMCTT